ncbi:glycosyltransferase [Arenicellales bacterium IMCC57338]
MRVSFLVPVYNTDPAILALCVNSVLKAANDYHEVILVDDATDRDDTKAFLQRCKDADLDNLQILHNRENAGVSFSLNAAATSASGEFLSPVDHDDVVVSQGFHQMLRSLRYHAAPWAYSDEAQVDAKGFLIQRLYKPDYSPQLLRSLMYINHLQIFSKTIFEKLGGYREGFEGSQDYDLALRMCEISEPLHVEEIAYHWRILEQTQSRVGEQLNLNAIDRARLAVQEHFDRLDKVAEVSPVMFKRHAHSAPEPIGVYRTRLVPTRSYSVSIIIPCRLGTTKVVDGVRLVLLNHCLQALKRSIGNTEDASLKDSSVEVVLVLNHDDNLDEAREALTRYELKGVALADQPGFDFSRKCNLGAQVSQGEVLVFLNDDTDIQTIGWVDEVISILQEDDVACVGGMMQNTDRSVQSCGDNVGRDSAVHYAPERNADGVGDPMHRYLADHETTSISGAFLCCRKPVYLDLNGFSEAFPNSFQDVDFCLRARAKGMRCITAPSIRLLHFESATRDAQVDAQTLNALRSYHGPSLAGKDGYAFWRYQPIYFSIFSYNGLKFRAYLCAKKIVTIARRFERALTQKPRCWRGVLKKSEYRVN